MSEIKEKPILFSGPMVRALLRAENPKTQTRRVVKPQPVPFGKSSYNGTRQGWKWKLESLNRSWNDDDGDPYQTHSIATLALAGECPHGSVGDRLWVRESWNVFGLCFGMKPRFTESASRKAWRYAADDQTGWKHGWKPSIHMPRWASRITLEIMKVRVERLQEISEADVLAEGGASRDPVLKWDCDVVGRHGDPRCLGHASAQMAFACRWDSIYGLGAWAKNPWVWVIEFKRL